jgi:two-component system, OmpR family, phosphate regulon sensor histidine kinase PhoR
MEAGRKAYQFSQVDLKAVIEHALVACRPMIEEGRFEVATQIDDTLPAIEADRDALVEVLINLISNAIKYSPEERSLEIRAERRPGQVAISVADRGIGIARSEQRRIFEKFYRVECRRTSEVGGSGIGLSLVDHIVRAHRGEVTLESTPGAGSTFTVLLPASPETESSSSDPIGVEAWRMS